MPTEESKTGKDRRICLLRKIVQADEKEKLQISYELHENIAQMLAAVRLHISLARNNIIGEGLAFLEEAESLVSGALSGVRTMATSISPIALKALGIKNSIDDLLHLLKEQKEIKCMVSIDDGIIESTSINNQNILYQAAQLQVINILKNSDATMLSIVIKPKKEKVCLVIKDNGPGINTGTIELGEGFRSIKERVEAFEGIFIMKSKEGKPGFTLEVII